jgi:hypothetical protein
VNTDPLSPSANSHTALVSEEPVYPLGWDDEWVYEYELTFKDRITLNVREAVFLARCRMAGYC